MNEREQWHLDKKVPVSIIMVLIVQIITGAWWASNMDSRLGHLEERDNENREVNRIVYGLQSDIRNIKDSLTRIERAVIERPDK